MTASLILTAAAVITMDPARPRASALAVDTGTGRIVAVGTVADCRAAAPDAEVRDLGDTVLLPGFIDSHSHPIVSGVATQEPVHWIAPYVGYPAWSDVVALFDRVRQEQPAGQPALFTGLDKMLQGVAEPDRTVLDQHFPDRPVAIIDNSGHAVYFNTETMKFLGWDTAPPADPVGGRYGRDASGALTGCAYELPAVLAVMNPLLQKVVPHPLASAAKWYRLMAENGVTATTDHTFAASDLSAYEALAAAPDVPLRLSFYHMSTEADCGEPITTKAPPELLQKVGIKLWGDGSPWVGNVANSFPYLDTDTVRKAGIPLGPGGEANMNYNRLELDAVLDEHAGQGWQMAFHINGDIGIDVVLDAYERALHNHGLAGTDHRWRLEHCGAGRADQFQRAARLGVTVSLSPFQFIYWGDLLDGEIFAPEIGGEWMQFHSAQQAGTQPSYHNDGSVSPPIPLLNIQAAVTRRTPSGRLHGADQAVSMSDALAAQTLNPARQVKRDHEVGSLQPGKLADLVELSADPYDVDPRELTDRVKVLGTWLAGKRIDLDRFEQQIAAIDPSQHAHLAKGPAHNC